MNYDCSYISDDSHQNQLNKQRRKLIDMHVQKMGYIELQSDYLGTDSYYYDNVNHIMYKVSNLCDWTGDVNPKFQISTDPHIFK